MEEEETKPILPKQNHPALSVNDGEVQVLESLRRPCVPVELVTSLYIITYIISVPVTTFYIYSKIAEKHGVKNFVKKGYSSCHNNSNHKNDVVNEIQKDAADQFLYLSLISAFPALISILYLGSLSDKYGRKVSLLIAFSGLLTREVIYVVVIYSDAPIFLLYIGHFIQGLTGYTSSALLAVYGIIADTTNPGKQRAFRLAVVEAVISITAGITSLASGYWIKYTGFLIPMVTSTLICLVSIAVTVIIIPETRCRLDTQIDVKGAFTRTFTFYFKDNETNRRKKLIACQIIIVFAGAAVLGKIRVETLFQLNRPLCWSELHVQIFKSVEHICNWSVGVVIVRVLLKYMQDVSTIFIGCVAGTLGFSIYAFTTVDFLVYVSAAFGTLAVTVIPMVKSLISRLVSVDEQGAMFASIAFVELLCHLVTSTTYSQLYKLTENSFPGMVFLVMAGLMFLALLVSTLLTVWMRESTATVYSRA